MIAICEPKLRVRRRPRARGHARAISWIRSHEASRRAVVHEDDLHVPVGALGDGAQALGEARQTVRVEVDGNDYGDEVPAHVFSAKKSRTAPTTASTWSSVSVGWIGRETTVLQAASDTGKSPVFPPRNS